MAIFPPSPVARSNAPCFDISSQSRFTTRESDYHKKPKTNPNPQNKSANKSEPITGLSVKIAKNRNGTQTHPKQTNRRQCRAAASFYSRRNGEDPKRAEKGQRKTVGRCRKVSRKGEQERRQIGRGRMGAVPVGEYASAGDKYRVNECVMIKEAEKVGGKRHRDNEFLD